ncbi:helix-turn-helix domain-containing protein [Rhizobium mongolense]|uniref:helix-turn-helix domain-containing protein n=1 Tax=Rhizobium mongolense TaxID=57676 RepID=UPI0035589B15
MAGYPTHGQIRAARSMLGLKQKDLASKANITRSVLLGLEQPGRKLPDNTALSKLRDAIEAEGLVLLDATGDAGEGVRWKEPSGKLWVECLRHGRAILGYSLDDLAERSGVGRYAISRIESGNLSRTPEPSARRLREVLFENGVVLLGEEDNLGAGVRLRSGIG